MRRHAMPEVKEGNVNVTPLIDVVMCLIIFFMLVAKIGVVTGSDKNVAVPEAFLGTNIAAMGNTMTVNITKEGTVTALVGNTLQELKLQDTINGKQVDPLKDTMAYFHDGDPSRGLPANPDFQVIIRGDTDLPFSSLAPVLIDCTRAHVKSWAFAAKPGQNPVEEGGAAAQ